MTVKQAQIFLLVLTYRLLLPLSLSLYISWESLQGQPMHIHWLFVSIRWRGFSVLSPRDWGCWKGDLPELLHERESLVLPGQVWTDFPLQAFLEQDLVIWVVSRLREWVTDSLGAFFPPAVEPLLPGLTVGLLCTLPLLFVLRNNMGDLWVAHRVHKPVSSNYFPTP